MRVPARTMFAWTWRAALDFAPLALATWTTPSLRGATTTTVLLGVALHQLTIADNAFARTS